MKWNTPKVQKKVAPVNGTSVVRRGTVGYNDSWDTDRAIEEALNRVTWVFRCVDAIASNAARQEIIMREGNPWDGEVVEDPDLYRLLNSKVNDGEAAIIFRYRLSAQLLLSKKGVFINVVRNNAGGVIEMFLLPPDGMEPIKDKKRLVKGWILNTTSADGRPEQKKFKAEDVIWIRRPHPFDPYKALTPLESAGLAIETDWLAKMYNRNFLLNDGRPGGMVVIKGDMMEEDKEELRARFSGGVARAGRISVIASDQGADFVDTAVTPRDAQYTESRQSTKDEILLGFGVPESVLANASGRTFDNAEVERLVFWQETMLPHLDLTYRPMDDLDDDDDHFLSVNLARVDVLQRMEMKRREFLLREYDAGASDLNEYRVATGREEIPGEWGKVHWINKNKKMSAMTDGSEFPEPVKQDAPKPQEGAGRPTSQDVTEQPENDPNAREDDRLPALPNSDTTPADQGAASDGKKAVDADFIASVKADYDLYGDLASNVVERLSERVARVVGQKVGGPKFRSAFFKDAGADELLEIAFTDETWSTQLLDDLTPIARGAWKDSNAKYALKLGVDTSEPEVKVSAMFVHQLKVLVGDALNEFVKSGDKDIDAFNVSLGEKIVDYMTGSKAKDYALGVVVQAYNEGIAAACSEVGCSKMWVKLADSPGQDRLDGEISDGEGFKLGRKTVRVPSGTLSKAVIVPVIDDIPVV